MSRIEQLSPQVINKIAAGEVIERPASVVKELMENSVDALATRIDVDIESGGSEAIRISDDGEGIHPDDLPLAVASHATSKILSADDLFSVRTMGFRGEALASIAEVSRFRIRSRQPDALAGVEMTVDAGRMGTPRPCGCPPGTQIEVRDLFFNVPVRRKFLKTASTEFGHISEQFTRIALANPRLHLTLSHNGKTIHDLPATSNLAERLTLFHGSELVDQLIPIEAGQPGLRLWGYVAHPSQSKSTRRGQYLFLNGRWIQDRSLQHALGESYRGLLMVGRYPIAFLFLEVDPDTVDVNVHPTKSEVRFTDSQSLYRLVLGSIRTKFLQLDLSSRVDATRLRPESAEAARSAPVDPEMQQEVQRDFAEWAKRELSSWRPSERLAEPPTHQAEPPEYPAWTSDAPPAPPLATGADEPAAAPEAVGERAEGAGSRGFPQGDVRAIQVHDCYLVVETGEGLTVIDQHALHERIMYEHLRRRVLDGAVEVQNLLVPVTVELTSREANLLMEQQDLLGELGLRVESFGGSTVLLHGYPSMLAKADPAEILAGVVEQLDTQGSKASRRDLLDALLHSMSCKAAIKAGQRLKPEEIHSLLEQRFLVDDTHHCPHGRPTALTLSRAELDRQFGRLG